jgi:hypothetical protein
MDVNVRRALIAGLCLCEVDIVTAQDDEAGRLLIPRYSTAPQRGDVCSSPTTKTCYGEQQNGNSVGNGLLASSMRIYSKSRLGNALGI